MKDIILKILKESEDAFVSGQAISDSLDVSRAAVWKYINKLKEEGYTIESVSKNGYRLVGSPDILTLQEVEKCLKTKYIGRNIIHYDTIDSTNSRAKELAAAGRAEGTVVISEEQTAGKGRFGRRWSSPKHMGIWMSVILKPDLDPINASNITLIGAAAVHKALEDIGVETKIKWPNDIILNNKKLCGILTEMSSELNQINYLVMGIGININTSSEEFPDEIKDMATSLKASLDKEFSRQEITAAVLNHFERLYEEYVYFNNLEAVIEICRKSSALIGREIELYNRGERITAKAIDINKKGLLIIEHPDGSIEEVISGEVSMNGLYGYKKGLSQ